MFFLALFLSVAFAKEPQTVPVKPGSEVRLQQGTLLKVSTQHYLVPEYQFDQLVMAFKDKPLLEDSLEHAQKSLSLSEENLAFCQASSQWTLEQSQNVIDTASSQYKADAALIADQLNTIETLRAENLTLQIKQKDLRSQRNTAIAIAGGLILGGVTVTVVAL